MNKRKKRFLIAAVVLIAVFGVFLAVRPGRGWHRDLAEYSLDERSFDSEAMVKIEEESGIELPDDAKGLAFHHIPPIDPIWFAKIQLPATSQDSITKQIEALPSSGTQFPKDFANERCGWWPTAMQEVILSKHADNNGSYLDMYLVKEKDDLILYIIYFTF